MINYFDIFMQNAQEVDLIKDKLVPAASTGFLIFSYTIPQFYTGYTTSFLIREIDADYNNFTFQIRINEQNIFSKRGLNPSFIPLLPEFMEIMRGLDKGSVIDLIVDNTGPERTILGWIKLVIAKSWGI